MKFTGTSLLALLAAGAVQAASSWTFEDGSVSVRSKNAADDATKHKFGPQSPLKNTVTLAGKDTLTVSLTAKEGSKEKRPHQAFLLLTDENGLEAPFPLAVKESGQGEVQITQKEIPVQFLASSKPIHATVVIGSFGPSQGIVADAFDVEVHRDANAPAPVLPDRVRYVKQPRIDHIFRDETKYPNKVFSYIFVVIIAATLPALLAGWFGVLGANLKSLPTALGTAPLSHVTFFGSIVGIEFVYYLYNRGMSLGHILIPVAVLGTTTVLSGMKALGEVQSRRLAGQR